MRCTISIGQICNKQVKQCAQHKKIYIGISLH